MQEDRSFAAFKAKMEAAVQATKNKTKSQKERKKKERVTQKQAWCAQLQRAQCYLGVRPRRGFVPKKVSGLIGWIGECIHFPSCCGSSDGIADNAQCD